MSNIAGVFVGGKGSLPFMSILVHSRFFGRVCVVHLFSFLCYIFCFVCLRHVSCVPNVASVSGLFILDCPFGFLWIVHSWLPLRFSLTFICPVSFVPNIASVSGLSILDCSLGFLWVVHSWLPLHFFLMFIDLLTICKTYFSASLGPDSCTLFAISDRDNVRKVWNIKSYDKHFTNENLILSVLTASVV